MGHRRLNGGLLAPTVRALSPALLLLGILFSSASAQEKVSDAEIVIRFGGMENDPVSKFINAQGAVTRFEQDEDESSFSWGVNFGPDFELTFGKFVGELVPEGRRLDVTFGEVLQVGRLIYSTGIIEGGEASAVDLQIALQLTRPAVPDPVIFTLPLTMDHFTEIDPFTGNERATGGRVNLPSEFPTIDITATTGTPYKLKVLGFGSIDAGGQITLASSLTTAAVEAVDLLASLELACEELECKRSIVPSC